MTPPSDNPRWAVERLLQVHGRRPGAVAHDGRFRRSINDREAVEARHDEWAARPPGRLGRRLLADVERYLEFFAIARAG